MDRIDGWIEFEYEGQSRVRLEAGSCVHQPPGIRHRELGHSDDIEMLEIVLPADFATEEAASVNDQPRVDTCSAPRAPSALLTTPFYHPGD